MSVRRVLVFSAWVSGAAVCPRGSAQAPASSADRFLNGR